MAIDTSSLQDKPWYYGAGIGAVLAVVIVFAVHYLWVRGINEEIRGQQAQLDELATKIAAGHAAQKKLPQFRDEVRQLELELESLRRILPSSRNTEEIIKKIKSLVDQGDFVLSRLIFPKLAEPSTSVDATGQAPVEEVYAEWPITVQVQGRYHDLAILFNRLGNFSRIVNVEQLTINALPVQLERTIDAEFIAKTFVYIEQKQEEPVPAASGG